MIAQSWWKRLTPSSFLLQQVCLPVDRSPVGLLSRPRTGRPWRTLRPLPQQAYWREAALPSPSLWCGADHSGSARPSAGGVGRSAVTAANQAWLGLVSGLGTGRVAL